MEIYSHPRSRNLDLSEGSVWRYRVCALSSRRTLFVPRFTPSLSLSLIRLLSFCFIGPFSRVLIVRFSMFTLGPLFTQLKQTLISLQRVSVLLNSRVKVLFAKVFFILFYSFINLPFVVHVRASVIGNNFQKHTDQQRTSRQRIFFSVYIYSDNARYTSLHGVISAVECAFYKPFKSFARARRFFKSRVTRFVIIIAPANVIISALGGEGNYYFNTSAGK